jgi:hypothetical protein
MDYWGGWLCTSASLSPGDNDNKKRSDIYDLSRGGLIYYSPGHQGLGIKVEKS